MNNDYESIARMLMNSQNGGKLLKNLDKITALLKTEQGKQMISKIAAQNPELLKKAMQAIMSNDKASAKKMISEIMSDEQSRQFAEKIISMME